MFSTTNFWITSISANLGGIKKWGNRNVECIPIVLNPAAPPKKGKGGLVNIVHSHTKYSLASFPGRSCLQFMIACSMQKRSEGEGLGERVMCMTSGRHEARHEGREEGRCLTKNLEVLLVIF